MKSIKTFFFCTALIVNQAVFADTIVKIGVAAPLTGEIAHFGKDIVDGAQLAVDEINRQNDLVIHGQKIKLQLDIQDDQADPRIGTQVAQKLVDDGVVAVIGHQNSGVSIVASKIYNDNDVTEITPASTAPQYTHQGYRTAFRLIGTDAQQGPALAVLAKKLQIKRMAVVDDATAFGQGIADQFSKVAKSEGITIVSREATTDKATDFKAILTKIKGEHVGGIFYGGMDATAGPFAKQAKQLGLQALILGGDGICTPNLVKLAGKAIDNIACSVVGKDTTQMPAYGEFTRQMQLHFHHDPVLYSPASYDAVHVLVQAMRRAGSITRMGILSGMSSVDYQGMTGHIQFDKYGDLKDVTISLYTYVNGQQQLIKDKNM